MAKAKSSRFYEIIVEDKINRLSDKEYQESLTPFKLRYFDDINLFKNFINKPLNESVIKHQRIRGTSPYYITIFSSTGKKIPFYIGYLKNSGSKSANKRFQINGKVPNFQHGTNYYAIGFLPTKNDEVVVIVEYNLFLSHKIKSKSRNNSSLWVNFENIKKAYFENILVIEQDNDKKRYIFRKSNQGILDNVLEKIFNDKDFDEESIKPSFFEPKDYVYKIEKLKRNSSLRDLVLKKSNYTCGLCNKKETFKDNTENWYFEAHHIIPFNVSNQKLFKITLDHLSNLICLCPECHRKVHFSPLKDQILSLDKIIESKELFRKNYRIETAEELVKKYYKGEANDE